MLEIRRKLFSDNLENASSLKDFNQEDVHRIITYGGREIYGNNSFTSLSNSSIKLNAIKRGKYDHQALKGSIAFANIECPFNKREYRGMDYLVLCNSEEEKKKLDKTYDIQFIGHRGLLFPENVNFPYFGMLSYILPKYHTKDSTWDFKFYISDNKESAYPVLTCPTNKKEWRDILAAFCEYTVFLKLFEGSYWKTIFVNGDKIFNDVDTVVNNERYFSNSTESSILGKALSFIPTTIALGYKIFGYPLIMGKLAKKLNECCTRDNPAIKNKLLSFGQSKFKDVYFVNLSTGSCFINPQNIDEDSMREIRKIGDPTRLRSIYDWVIKAYDEGKFLIFYSDIDNSVAMAHEMGHYLEEIDGTYGKIQRASHFMPFTDGFIKFFGFCLGLVSSILMTPTKAMFVEIGGILESLLSKSPTLICEFMASYKGLELLRQIGCSQSEVEEAASFYKAAYGTYVASAINTSTSVSSGRVFGTIGKWLDKK